MPLSFSGDKHTTINSTDYRAFGSQNEMIIVEASHEAIQDFGEDAVQYKASAKYDTGQASNNRVTVRTSDFV
jgi:hypothetical protein